MAARKTYSLPRYWVTNRRSSLGQLSLAPSARAQSLRLLTTAKHILEAQPNLCCDRGMMFMCIGGSFKRTRDLLCGSRRLEGCGANSCRCVLGRTV